MAVNRIREEYLFPFLFYGWTWPHSARRDYVAQTLVLFISTTYVLEQL